MRVVNGQEKRGNADEAEERDVVKSGPFTPADIVRILRRHETDPDRGCCLTCGQLVSPDEGRFHSLDCEWVALVAWLEGGT